MFAKSQIISSVFSQLTLDLKEVLTLDLFLMEALEIFLLVLSYTLLIVAIFLQLICYGRNIEALETIYFTGSLLFLIVALTMQHFFEAFQSAESTNFVIQIAIVLVALTTPLNIFTERKHNLNPLVRKGLMSFSVFLGLAVILAQLLNFLHITQYVVATFLGGSVVFSMVLIRMTKPASRIAHREKVERMMAIGMIVFVPLSLWANYASEVRGIETKVGFTLPLVFIVLSVSKIWDDIQRLSLFKPENTIKDQNLQNYALSKREQEVAELLMKGKTYNVISEELFISVPTVKTHVTNIYGKCKVKNRAELISVLTG